MAQQTCIHVNCFLAGDNTMCHSILKMHIVGKKPSETPSASRCLSYLIGSSLTDIAWRRQWHPTPVLLPRKPHGWRSLEGCSPWGPEESDTTERLHFHFHFHALEKKMATHSSVLAWRIPGMGEPGGLLSMGSHIVGHNWSDLAAAAAAATDIATVHGVAKSRTRLSDFTFT